MDGNDQSGLFDELNSLVPAQGQQPAAAAPAPAQNDLFADLDSLIPRSNPGPVGVSAAQMPQLDSTLANVGKQFAYGAVADGFSRIPEGVAITAANIQNKTVRGLNSPEEGGARTIEKNKLIARLRGPEGQDPQNAKEILAQLTDMGIAESEIRGLLERGPISAKDIPDYHYGEDLRRATRGALGGVNENDTSTSGQIARMAGGFTGMAVGAAATGAVAGPAAAALYAAGQGATLNESMIYDDAIAAGADEETAQQAAQLGGAAGAAMAIPVLNSLKFLPSAVKSKITNAFLGQIAQVSEKSGTAAALMYAQTVGNNLIAQTSYDENRSLAEGGWEALLTGAVFGVVGHAISEAPGAVKALKFNPAELGPAEKPAPSTAAEATAEIAPDVAVALGAKDPAALVDEIMGGSQAAQVTPGGKVDVKAADATPKDVTGSAAQGAENAKASDGTTTEAKNPATVEIEQLKDRKNPRKAVFIPFTDTTTEPPHGAGIMMEPTDAGVIYYHTGKGIGKAGVKALLKSGQAANVLKIGPYTKAMMGADTPAAPEATVTAPEVAPEAAPAAPVAPVPSEAAQALSALSKAPEASVAAPSEASVAADRLPAAPEPAAPAPSEAAAAVERLVPPELDYSKYAEEAPAPAPEPVAAEPVAREAAPTAPAAKPKVEVIKAKSRAKSGKPAAVDKSEAKSTEEPAKVKVVKPAVEEQPAVAREQIDPKTGKRQFILKTSEEVKKASDRFNRPIQDRMRNEGLSSAEVAATKRPEAYDEINRAADAGEMDPRTEAQARQDNSGSKISKAEKERAVEDNVRAAEIMKLHADRPFEQVATMEDIGPIKERLDAVLLAANEAGITIPERVSTTTANATAWLTDVKMMASKLARAKAIGSNKRSAFVKDLNSWLVDEAVAAKGDSGPMRARRKLVGEQISGGRIAGGSDVENLVGDVIGASDARDNVGAEINNDSAARNAEAPASRGQSSKGSARLSDGSEKREVVVGRDKDGKARVAQVTAAKAASEVRKVDPASIGLTQDRIDAMFAETSKADKTRVAVDEASAAETRAAKPENEVKDDIAVITPAGKEAAKTRRKPQTMAEAKAELARLVAEDKARREAGKLPEEDPDYPIARKEADGTTGARPWDAANQTPEDRARERLFNEEFAGKEEDFDHAETSVNELANELIDPDGMLNSSSKTRKIVRTDDEAQRTMTQSAEALDVLLANAEDIKVIVVRDADMEHYTGSAMGYYDPIMDRIVIAQKWLMDAADALAVLVHETAHAVFYHKLESDKLVRGKMQILLNAARDQAVGKQADHYGLTDVHEFTSELWGNTRFQDMLSQMHLSLEEAKSLGLKMADRGRIRNLLDAFKKVLFDALGLEKLRPANSTDLSLLNLGLEVSKELLAGSKTARGNRETIMARLIEQQTAKNDLKFAKDERKAGTLKLPTVNPPEGVAGDLARAGIPREAAEAMAAKIEANYGGKVTPDQVKALAAAYAKNATLAGKAATQEATAAQSQAVAQINSHTKAATERMAKIEKIQNARLDAAFIPAKNPGRARMLMTAGLDYIGRKSDDFFGSTGNPVREFEKLWNQRPNAKEKEMASVLPVIENGVLLANKYAKTGEFNDLQDLMIDARMAEVHPNFALDDKMNAHLGKDAMVGFWGKAAHADLEARFNALPDDLKAYYEEARAMYTDRLDRMSEAVTDQTVEDALRDKGLPHDPAIAKRFHDGKATDADKLTVGAVVASHLENAREFRKVAGPYFDLNREGDFAVVAKHKVTAPGNGKLIGDDIVEFKTRAELKAYIETQVKAGGPKITPTSKWVDKTTGKDTVISTMGGVSKEVRVSKNDANAEERFYAKVQTEHLEFLPTMKEAKARAEELRAAGLGVRDAEPKRYERQSPNGELLGDQMRAISKTVDNQSDLKGMSAARKADLQLALNELSLRFRGNTRIQRNMMPTRYVSGASRDVMRNMLQYADRSSGYLARVTTQRAINDALVKIDKARENLSWAGKGAGAGARDIQNEVERRAYDRNYQSDFAKGPVNRNIQRLLTLTFLRHLMSPFYTIFNLAQPHLLTGPVLMGQYGAMKAQYHLIKAYHDIGSLRVVGGGVADTVKATYGGKGRDFLSDIMKRLKDPGERAMLQELVNDRTLNLDGGLEVDKLTAQIAKNSKGVRGVGEKFGAGVDSGLEYMDGIARAMPAAAEAINRTVSAIASYRLEMGRSKDPAKALQAARDTIKSTQFDYSHTNSAPVFNTPVGRVVLQFKKFGANAYYLLGRNMAQAIKGGEPGVRWKAVKTLTYLMATHAVAAGAMGMPFIEIAKVATNLLNIFGVTDKTWADVKYEFEQFMKSIAGDTAGDMIANGVSRGIPGGFGFDAQSRIGADSLMTFGDQRSDDPQDVKAYLFDMFAGAGVGTVFDQIAGAKLLLDGKFGEAAEKLLPAKFMADAMKARNEMEAGRFNAQDAMLRAMGATSDRQAEISADRGAQIRAGADKSDLVKKLMADYIQAITPADVAKATSALREYNRTVPKGGRKYEPKSLEKLRQKNLKVYQEN